MSFTGVLPDTLTLTFLLDALHHGLMGGNIFLGNRRGLALHDTGCLSLFIAASGRFRKLYKGGCQLTRNIHAQ